MYRAVLDTYALVPGLQRDLISWASWSNRYDMAEVAETLAPRLTEIQ